MENDRFFEIDESLAFLHSELYKAGEDVTKLVSMCKLKGGRLVREVTDSCLQFWGGMGFTKEVKVLVFFSVVVSVLYLAVMCDMPQVLWK